MNRIRGGSGAQARPSRGLGEPVATPLRQRPILFSGPMVRALLSGTKTQTRRIVKPQPHHGPVGEMVHLGDGGWAMDDGDLSGHWQCPYGVPGDLLIVRETFRLPDTFDPHSPAAAKLMVGSDRSPNVFYLADSSVRSAGSYTGSPGKTRVSIHMPRWASRLTLEITDVRVERLQDISEADAVAEGVSNSMDACGRMFWTAPPSDDFINSARFAYLRLWDAINGDGSAAANPWVWAVSFKVHAANVDQMAPEDGSQSGGEPREDGSISRRAVTNSPTITFPPGGKK
jgi:hypothetical protein